jgi:RNA polymerase sigma-70 factor (ECF subfamily)
MLEHVAESHAPDAAAAHGKRSTDQESPLASPPDLLLVERARSQDPCAFEMLMRRYNRRLFRIARSILPDEGAAENVVQEAYIKAFSNLERYEPMGKFAAWLARLTFNQALALRRSLRPDRTASVSKPEDAREYRAAVPAALSAALGQIDGPQAREMLEHAIDTLPEVFRTVFILRAVERLSGMETAACLGINETTVRTRLYRAQKRLRVSMARRVPTERATVFELPGSRSDHIVDRVFARLNGAAPPQEQAESHSAGAASTS